MPGAQLTCTSRRPRRAMRNPSPMPTTRARVVAPVTRSVTPCCSTSTQKTLHVEASAVSDDVAVIAKSQTRPDYTMTFRELRDEVRRVRQGLGGQGRLAR